jgi:hypothetical protein
LRIRFVREYAWMRPCARSPLVDPERVERGRVEAGQEHVDDDRDVELAVPQAQREVLVVVLEAVRRGVEARPEHRVIVLDRPLEEVA